MSEFEILYGRNLDIIYVILFFRIGIYVERKYNVFVNRNFVVRYEVNWKIYEIKVKGYN